MSDTDESAVLVDTPSTLTSEPELVTEDEVKKETAQQPRAVSYETDEEDDMEMTEVTGRPTAYQIVSIGSEEDRFAFQFHKEKLNAILAKVPAKAEVAVVSVVGAFRTGKSFLLR
jgi:Guanylate-binding protein, N-terminal domain